MNTAKKYFQKQLSVPEFKQSYMEEKVNLDIEYQLEEMKNLAAETAGYSKISPPFPH